MRTERDAASGKPRKETRLYMEYANARNLITELLCRDWVDSFPVGTLVPGIDERDVEELVCLCPKTGELTWQGVRVLLLEILQGRGIECGAITI
jgi:hypothetical protein